MIIKRPSDLWTGLLFIFIGLGVMLIAKDYRIGTSQRMGPGYLPLALALLLVILGCAVALGSLRGKAEQMLVPHLRPLVFVLVGSLLFAVTLRELGLPISVMIMVLVVAVADPGFRVFQALLAAAILAALATLLFPIVLSQPIPILGRLLVG
jgi:hypothetical protein